MISKTNAPQNHQFKTFINIKKIMAIKFLSLSLDNIQKIFHPILKSSLSIDPTKRRRFDQILDHLIDAYIEVANIP